VTSFLALSFAVGFLHAVTPDHWMPYSLRAWQRSRSAISTALGLVPWIGIHLALGLVLFVAIRPFVDLGGEAETIFSFSVVFVLLAICVRSFRYSRLIEAQRSGPRGAWGAYAMVSLLGPAESLVPILIQARHWGVSLWPPFLAYSAGTSVALGILVLAGRWAWNRPGWMVRSLAWSRGGGSWPAMVIVLGLGLAYVFGF
jgi:hypothetical protein